MSFSTADYLEHGRMLAETKAKITDYVLESGRTQGATPLEAQRQAARVFYIYVEQLTKLKQSTVCDLVRIYQRFGAPEYRSLIELFKVSELSVLASKSDDLVNVAISAKKANPGLRREELRQLLK